MSPNTTYLLYSSVSLPPSPASYKVKFAYFFNGVNYRFENRSTKKKKKKKKQKPPESLGKTFGELENFATFSNFCHTHFFFFSFLLFSDNIRRFHCWKVHFVFGGRMPGRLYDDLRKRPPQYRWSVVRKRVGLHRVL